MHARPNIVLSPHFDDAVLSLGGLIAKAPEHTIVATVFAGTPSHAAAGRWDRWSGFATAAEAMRARRAENEAALGVVGIPPQGIRNLDFLDRQYRREPGLEAGLRAQIGASIRRLVDEHGGAVDLFVPASAWHPDHQLVSDAAFEAVAAGGGSGSRIFLYQDQPYAYLELRSRSLTPLKFADFTLLDSVAKRHKPLIAQRQFIGLDERDVSLKLQAIRKYASQFPVIRHLLYKMIRDFSRHQARAAGLGSRHVEVVYRLVTEMPR
jgi:LmbE family N-acetylglucosaminyl deacetylase